MRITVPFTTPMGNDQFMLQAPGAAVPRRVVQRAWRRSVTRPRAERLRPAPGAYNRLGFDAERRAA
jgi:hypothetical protein